MTTDVAIKSQFVRDIPSDGVYRIKLDVIDVVNIEFDVLVFNTEDQTFSHVATVFDMETYPAGYEAAAAAHVAFFRDRGVEMHFGTLNEATGFEQVTENRLKILAVAWKTVLDAFAGTEIVTASSSES